MKNILILLTFALFYGNCTTLEFEQPLPTNGNEIKTLPRNLVGTYQSTQDSGSIVRVYQRIVFIPKDASWDLYTQAFVLAAVLDTTKEALVRNDSLFGIESDTSSPEFAFMVKRIGDRYIAAPKLQYHIEPTKGKFVSYDEGTGNSTTKTLILRKLGDVYYFNMKEAGAKYWQITTLQQIPEGIRFEYLSSPHGNSSDLPFATREVVGTTPDGIPDTTRVANPTDLELEQYRRNTTLVNSEALLRVEEQK